MHQIILLNQTYYSYQMEHLPYHFIPYVQDLHLNHKLHVFIYHLILHQLLIFHGISFQQNVSLLDLYYNDLDAIQLPYAYMSFNTLNCLYLQIYLLYLVNHNNSYVNINFSSFSILKQPIKIMYLLYQFMMLNRNDILLLPTFIIIQRILLILYVPLHNLDLKMLKLIASIQNFQIFMIKQPCQHLITSQLIKIVQIIILQHKLVLFIKNFNIKFNMVKQIKWLT